MSFDWSEYLVVARELASQTTTSAKAQSKFKVMLLYIVNLAYFRASKKVVKPSLEEAKLRCAISRAYYGAFRKARNHLRDKDGYAPSALERGNTHQIVINLFDKSSDIDRQLIGQFLRDLRSARNRADYDDVVPNLPGLTTTVLLQSEQVIELLKTL